MSSQLDIKFKKAFADLSQLKESLPQDIMLKLYAYYKQGIEGDSYQKKSEPNLVNGFKLNAWTQLNGMAQDDAKKAYIKLANSILNKPKTKL